MKSIIQSTLRHTHTKQSISVDILVYSIVSDTLIKPIKMEKFLDRGRSLLSEKVNTEIKS